MRREALKRERGEKCHTSPVWETKEIGERGLFGVRPTIFIFSSKLRRKMRETLIFNLFPFLPLPSSYEWHIILKLSLFTALQGVVWPLIHC